MTMTTSGYLRTLAWSRTALLGAAFSLGAFFACPALAWNPGGHVWNGAAGDNNLDNAANWVTNKTNGGFSTTKFAAETPPGPNDVAVFPYGNYNFTLPHDYDWGILYLGGYGTAANRGDFICDLDGHTLTVSNKSTVAGMATGNGAGDGATNFVFRNGSVKGFNSVNPANKRTWSFIDCPYVSVAGTDWGSDAGAIYVDNSGMTLGGQMRFGRNVMLVVSNGASLNLTGAFGSHNTQAWPSNIEVRVEGQGSRFVGGQYRVPGEDMRVRVLDGASMETVSMLCSRTGGGACTNCLLEVRNASFKETGDNTGYRGNFGFAGNSFGCRIVMDHPVAFSVPTAMQMVGTSNEFHMAGSTATYSSSGFTFGGNGNKVVIDDGARIWASGQFSLIYGYHLSVSITNRASVTAQFTKPLSAFDYTVASDVRVAVSDGGLLRFQQDAPFRIDGTNVTYMVNDGTLSCTNWGANKTSGLLLGVGTFKDQVFGKECVSPALEIAGKQGKVEVFGKFESGTTYGVAKPAELRFVIPSGGWEEAPLSIQGGTTTIRDETIIRCRRAKGASLPAYVPLMRFDTSQWITLNLQALSGHADLPSGASLVYSDGILGMTSKPCGTIFSIR